MRTYIFLLFVPQNDPFIVVARYITIIFSLAHKSYASFARVAYKIIVMDISLVIEGACKIIVYLILASPSHFGP